MANGAVKGRQIGVGPHARNVLEGPLLDAATSTTSSPSWALLDGNWPFTITLDGTFVGTVKFYASNDTTAPTTFAASAQLGNTSGYTAPDTIEISRPYKWICGQVSAYTSGTINAYVMAGGTYRS